MSVAAALAGCLVAAGPAAAGTPDQQQTNAEAVAVLIIGPDSGPLAAAQTFTAGLTGDLDRVDLHLGNYSGNSVGLTVEIRNVSAGAPGGDVLASDTIDPAEISPAGSPGEFVSATFASPAPVTAGTPYAIVAHTDDADQYEVGFTSQDVYAGGQPFFSSTLSPGTWAAYPLDELAFKTYVERPAPAFSFTGFLGPVDNAPTVNSVKAGAGVPVKFSLGADHGLDILDLGSPSSQQVACASGSADAIEETVTANSSGLQYDPVTDVYTYVWKTQKSWARTCRQLTVTLNDGTSHVAHFQFT